MNELLERLVPRRDEHADWNDVLRRAGRGARPRRRYVLAGALLAAALAGAPALGFLLMRDAGARLPKEADLSRVAVIAEPGTGRILLKAAPWKGHDGACYVLLARGRSGCIRHRARGTAITAPPLFGWTFDRRVVSGTAETHAGRRVPLVVRHFGGRMDITFVLARGRLPLLRNVELRDARGRVVAGALTRR